MGKTFKLALLTAAMAWPLSTAQAADKTKSLRQRADAIVATFQKPGRPGCAVGVFQDGSTLYTGAFGLANLEHAIRINPERTVFDIGSVSKQFTAASILLLVQDGKLKLDDDIRKYLPEMPDYGKTITIDHLLHHTSGLRDYLILRWTMGKSSWGYMTEQDAFGIIAKQKGLNFDPGAKYAYSNTGFILAAAIVRKVSGKSLAAFAHERIFTPLGMTDTYYNDSPGRTTPHHATGYVPLDNGAYEARSKRSLIYGDGGLQTTIPDLAKWQRNFDDPRVGGPQLIRQLEENGVLNDGTKISYARGLEVDGPATGHRGVRTVYHSGATWDGYISEIMQLPDFKFSIASLCNTNDNPPFQLREMLLDVFLEGRFPSPPQPAAEPKAPEPTPNTVPISADVAASFVGTYWNREDVVTRVIELKDGKLWYVRGSTSRSELVSGGDGKLRMVGVPGPVVIERMPSTSGRQVVRVTGDKISILEKVDPASTDAKSLAELAGVYVSQELEGARLTFVVRDEQLALDPSLEGIESLKPAFRDAFFDNDDEMLWVFQRNAAGQVTSLLMDNARVRNLVFQRVSGPPQ